MNDPVPSPDKDGFLYGVKWKPSSTAISREVYCIQQGGSWTANRKRLGAGLFIHYRNLQTLLWPDHDHHRWSDLILKAILDNRITAILGPKDCGKTHTMAMFALTDYFCFPNETLILMSSTDMQGLQLRVWGEIKDLYQRASEQWDECPGNVLESEHGIFTDELTTNGEPRDLRKGLICVAMKDSSGQWVGLRKYTGIKQKRRRLLGDEVQFYADSYVSALANLNKNDFKCVVAGNPIGEGDPLDKLAEPEDGWDSQAEIAETTTWKNRQGGITINLVGLDSPAIAEPDRYPYLINQKDIDYIANYWGKESAEFYNQAAGIRRPGISLKRVVTRDMVIQFGAQEEVVWKGSQLTKVYAIDAGYGGDRCVAGEGIFGLDINNRLILTLSAPRIVPIRVYPKDVPEAERLLPEDQIAEYVKADCERLSIPSANVFHDATGRGSLGTSFARLWRDDTNPVEFGGSPTPRPVLADLYIYDEKLRQKRLKRCDEHYSKRVSELHFSVRYTIEAGQLRGLTNDVMDELTRREWTRVRGNKIEVESKEDTKERLGRSPDLADWCAIVVEAARSRGFHIAKLDTGKHSTEADGDNGWRDALRERAKRIRANHALNYAA